MTALEIIDEYNRNIRRMSFEETMHIYKQRVTEYRLDNQYVSEAMFLYPEVLCWDENWLSNMKAGKSPEEIVKEYFERKGNKL